MAAEPLASSRRGAACFALSLLISLGSFAAISLVEGARWGRRAGDSLRVDSLRQGDWFYFDTRLATFLRSHLAKHGPDRLVVCIGDSITWCDGLPAAATWPLVLDRITSVYMQSSTRFLNAGCNGTALGYAGRGLTLMADLPLQHRLVLLNPHNHARFRWPRSVDPEVFAREYRADGRFLADESLLRGFGNTGRLSPIELQLNRRLVATAPWLAFYKERKNQLLPLLRRIPKASQRPRPTPPYDPLAAATPPADEAELPPVENTAMDTITRYHPNTAQFEYLVGHLPGPSGQTSFALAPTNLELLNEEQGLDPQLLPMARKRLQELGAGAGVAVHGASASLPRALYRVDDPVHFNNLGCWVFARQLQRAVPFLRSTLPAFEILSPHPEILATPRQLRQVLDEGASLVFEPHPATSRLRAPAGARAYLEAEVPDRYLLSWQSGSPTPLRVEVWAGDNLVRAAELGAGSHDLVLRSGQLRLAGARTPLPPAAGGYRIRLGFTAASAADREVTCMFLASFLFAAQTGERR